MTAELRRRTSAVPLLRLLVQIRLFWLGLRFKVVKVVSRDDHPSSMAGPTV